MNTASKAIRQYSSPGPELSASSSNAATGSRRRRPGPLEPEPRLEVRQRRSTADDRWMQPTPDKGPV